MRERGRKREREKQREREIERETVRERETGRMINVNICSLHGPMNCKKDRQREQDKVIYRVDERERVREKERERERERDSEGKRQVV